MQRTLHACGEGETFTGKGWIEILRSRDASVEGWSTLSSIVSVGILCSLPSTKSPLPSTHTHTHAHSPKKDLQQRFIIPGESFGIQDFL